MISLCMIVKNGEKKLAKCLENIKELVGEIIIVDTGSNDNTKEIARKFGAKIFDFNWIDDFGKARNFAYSKASGDWILNLDDDECISSSDFDKIKKAIKNTDKIGFYLTQRNYTNRIGSYGMISCYDDIYPESKVALGYIPQKIVRLFKNNKGVTSEGVIHDSVIPSIQKINGSIGEINVVIHHYGTIEFSPEKIRKYVDIEMKNIKNDYYQEFQIGLQLSSIGAFQEALEHLNKSLALNQNFQLTWIEIATIFIKCGKISESKPLLEYALNLSDNESVFNLLGIVSVYQGKIDEAINFFNKAINKNNKNADYYFNLGQAFKQKGEIEEARKCFDKAVLLNYTYKDKI